MFSEHASRFEGEDGTAKQRANPSHVSEVVGLAAIPIFGELRAAGFAWRATSDWPLTLVIQQCFVILSRLNGTCRVHFQAMAARWNANECKVASSLCADTCSQRFGARENLLEE